MNAAPETENCSESASGPIHDQLFPILAERLKALADPTRLRMVNLLMQGERTVGDVAEGLGLRHGTASSHLGVLSRAGIVGSRKDGTRAYYCITNPMVHDLCKVMCQGIKDEFERNALLARGVPVQDESQAPSRVT